MPILIIDETQTDLDDVAILNLFINNGTDKSAAETIVDEIICGHGYFITSESEEELNKLASALKDAGVKLTIDT